MKGDRPGFERLGYLGSASFRCVRMVLMMLFAVSVLVVTGKGASAENLQFDIPAQQLDAALDAFGAISHLQVLYESALTAGRISTAIRGNYTRETALRKLLAGTGFDFAYTEAQSFTLIPAQPQPTYRMANFDRFLGRIQSDVMAALCQQPETRPGAYRLAMQFWVDKSGRLENLRLLSSTGADPRDAAITHALSHMEFLEAPPANLPQPVTMILKADTSSGGEECQTRW